MSSTLQIVDPDSTSTVLFDLNDAAGTNSALYGSVDTAILSDPDFGTPKIDTSSTPDSARAVTFNRQGVANLKLRVRIYNASSYDNLNKALGKLAYYLGTGCVMKWVPNGSSETRYIDVLPSDTPVLMDGRELGVFEVTQLFDTPHGVTLNLQRLGYLRGDKLDPATNKLLNSTMIRDSDGDGTPDSWTKVSTPTLTIAPTTDSLHIVAGAATRGVYQATGSASASSGQSWTLSADVLVTSGTASLVLDWRTGADANISNTTQTTTAAVWTRVSVTGTAPATTDHIRATLQSSGAAATFDVRNVQLEQAASASLYRVAAETMRNSPTTTSGFAGLMPIYNPTDAPAPCEITAKFPDASSNIVEVDYGLISNNSIAGSRYLSDYLNGPNYAVLRASGNGWTRTLGASSTAISDAGAADGLVSVDGNRISFTGATNGVMESISKVTRTTLLDSLRGRWQVLARGKFPHAGLNNYQLQLLWGAGTTTSESEDVVSIDYTLESVAEYQMIPVGYIHFPREKNIAIGQITLDLWGSTDGNQMHVDSLFILPADDSAVVEPVATGSVSITGDTLTTPPKNLTADPGGSWSAGDVSIGNNVARLNAVNEAVGWGDNTNGLYTGVSGISRLFVWKVKAHTNNKVDTISVTASIADITGDTEVAAVSADYAGNVTSYLSTLYTESNTHKFQPRIYVTARVSGYVDIQLVTMDIVTGVGQNGQVRSDPGSLPTRNAVEALDSSGNLTVTATASGVPFWLPPGLSLIYVLPLDMPVSPGAFYNQSFVSRTMTVTPAVYPRWWQ
jgi:hypothetical protein